MRGAGDDTKRRAIFNYYRVNADFLICQETHGNKETQNIWTSEWGGEAIYGHGTTSARGIAIFYTKKHKVKNIYIGNDGRLIIFDVEENDYLITIVAIYAPNQDCPAFFTEIEKLLKDRGEHKIIVGDFNLTLDVDLDRYNTYNNNSKAKLEVENIMDQYRLNDVWRTQNPDRKEYSWKKGGNTTKMSRIDYALVSGGLDQYVKACQYLTGIKTDHRAFYMVVDLDSFERGTGYWKFNTTLLQDKTFVEQMSKEIDKTLELSFHKNPVERWETLKVRVKKVSQEYSRNKTSEDKLVISQLSEKVIEYESNQPLNQAEEDILNRSKIELEEKLFERTRGIMFRSKVKWYEEGERNTKYFFSLEKARYNAKTCFKIIEDDKEITHPEQILEAQKKFYGELYGPDPQVKFNMENIYGIKVKPEDEKKQSEQLTLSDLEIAVKGMKNNKTPGEDGIPVDFYKVFWRNIKSAFMDTVLKCYDECILHGSARKGILNLIPKSGKDTRYIKNLRPITLLNTDYKIIEKAIANKMLPALEYIIHKDQRGFMKNRRISVNIRKMLDIMHHVEVEDMEAVILSLDFVKCFDKCSFSILHGSLEFFGFGEIVKTWTKILYKEYQVRIQNNGHFSSPIDIKKGVHQGGCCSAVYFLVIAEILALALRDNQKIKGITVKDIKHLLNQFADDMDVCSESDEESIRNIYEELDKFKSQSGFTPSYDKTTMYRIGSLRHSNAKMYDLDTYAWSNQDITVLGVTVSHEDLVQKNYDPIVEKVKKILNLWYNRGLSLLGKVQVVNTLVASLFVYKMMVLPKIPNHLIKIIDSLIREFLWGGKKAKIAYRILQNPKRHGGLNLVNISNRDHALKATWPQILHEEQDYAKLVYKNMRVGALGEDIWRCSIAPQDVKLLRIKDGFWEDVLISWNMFNYYNEQRIENSIIWLNSKIKIGNKLVMWKDVYDRGLKYVHQLFDDQQYKSHQKVYEEFGLTTLRYNSLKGAIPLSWKEYFHSTSRLLYTPIIPSNYDMTIHVYSKGLANKIYKYISDDIMLVHYKYIKWKQDIGENFCDGILDFGELHRDIYRITNVPKYRSFQYRLLQRGLVTNIQLTEWKMIESDLCSYCCKHRETVVHLFVECEVVMTIWEKLMDYVQEIYGTQKYELNPKAIITNYIIEPKQHIVNFWCLITKQYIYRQRCLKKHLNFSSLKVQIENIRTIEKYIAIKNGKMAIHKKKWELCGHEYRGTTNADINEYIVQYLS